MQRIMQIATQVAQMRREWAERGYEVGMIVHMHPDTLPDVTRIAAAEVTRNRFMPPDQVFVAVDPATIPPFGQFGELPIMGNYEARGTRE